MPAIPTNEPEELRAGVQWEWRREDLSGDFPANGGWALKYWFKKTGATPGNFSIDATADGVNFAVTVLAATTSAYVAGDYTWAAIVTKTTEIREVDSGRLKILPRYDAAANLDDRSHVRKVLEAVEAVIENRASKTQRELVAFTIGSRGQTFDSQESKSALLELHSRYKWLASNEDARARIAAGLGNPRNIRIRFGSP